VKKSSSNLVIVNCFLQNLDAGGLMIQLTFSTLMATVLSQLFLFCWYGNDLTYEVTYFMYLDSLRGGNGI